MNRDLRLSLNDEPVRLSVEHDFALGDLEIHPSVSEVIRDGQGQHVEPRVMQVLVVLAGAGGAVVSRDELIRRCWDGRVVGEAAINRCMSRLRALADRGDGTRSFTVETIARVGYRLRAATGSVEASAPAEVSPTAPPRTRRAILGVAALAIAAVVALGYGIASRKPDPAAHAAPEPSIAVLPFKDLSADADAAYFADAIQDEILTRLAKIGSLKVISRTSAVEAAGKPGTLADIARTLGVANVLEGSVQRAGDKVRVNVQLIRAATDDHLWAEAYDRPLDDVLSVENDIAGSIATVLAAKITPGESRALAAKPTTNGRAYDLYLRALVGFQTNEEPGWLEARAALDQAVVLDPKFALAWALLARIDANISFGHDDADQIRHTRHALDEAMALAPDLAEVQLAHAEYTHYVERDYQGAERELKSLHARWPNNIDVLRALGFVARRLGHWQEALGYFRQAQALDPLSRDNVAVIAETLIFAHRPAEAVHVVGTMREIWRDDPVLIACEADKLQALGELDRADAGLRLLPSSADAAGDTLWQRRAQYAYRRQFAEGLAWFEALRASSPLQEWDQLRRATLELSIGDFRRWSGDTTGARASYQTVAEMLRASADGAHPDSDVLMLSAVAYAGLGDRERALHYVRPLSEGPLANDAMNGAIGNESMARALARLDDRDGALAAVERLLREPSDMTSERLRLDPDFDALRGDARFERLLAEGATPLD
ncbi:MAG TPA: winged helix-turn-helix domain-containing protein [Rhodanobacteraceae bacterium]|nr:winged helix-turn-helix domain-containing protein [Rhodanobacteraceae bacterium]